jgi:type IV pilus assembly protein PilM
VLEPGVVRDGEVVDVDALAHILRALFAESRLDKRVRIGVANQRVVVRHLLLPPITDAKELETAVRFQAAAELPMPLDKAVLDHVSLGVVDTPDGPRLRVLVVAARRDMIDHLLGAARQAGLRPEGIDLSAFAMVRALRAPTDVPILHLAVGGVVNLAVTSGGECVFTRVIAGGLEAMALELAERRGMTVDEARAALLLAGVPLRGESPAPEAAAVPEGEADSTPAPPVEAESDGVDADARTVLADGVRRISAEVRNSIDFHLGAEVAGLAGEPGAPTRVERVLLTGSAVAVPGLAEALAERLALPVEVADVAGADAPGRYAVAAGLAVEEAPA